MAKLAMDSSAVAGLQGKWKILTLLIGAIVIALAAHSSSYQTVTEHENFFTASILCFIISLILFIAATIGLAQVLGIIFLRLDAIFHLLAAVLLAASSIIFLVHVVDHRTGSGILATDGIQAERISAGALGLLNAVLYAHIAWINLQ